MKARISKAGSWILLLMGLFGVIFLTIMGIAYSVHSHQFTHGMTPDQISMAALFCYISAAIYGLIALFGGSQAFLHSRRTRMIGDAPVALHEVVPKEASSSRKSK